MKNLMEAYGVAAAVDAATETGLLDALAQGPATPAVLAGRLGLDERATGQVLAILVAMGAARRKGDAVQGTPELAGFLAAEHRAQSRALFGHVPAWLKTGTPLHEMLDPAERESTYRRVAPGLGRMFRTRAEQLAAVLPVAPGRVLDVGCGSGVWSLAIAARHPSARVTGLDLPAVLDGFRALAEEWGLADRTATLPGDVHEAALPAGAFDLAVVANVLRIESEARARDIVDRVAPAVAAGGAILVVDALAGGTPERDLAREVYGMHLALRNRDGRVHTRATIRGWLRDAGFPNSVVIDFPGPAVESAALLFTR